MTSWWATPITIMATISTTPSSGLMAVSPAFRQGHNLNTLAASLLPPGWQLEMRMASTTPTKSSGRQPMTGTSKSRHTHAFILTLPLPLSGDANMDGKVDINDLTKVLANYNQSTGMNWGTGDFNGDGKVDINDLTIVLAHFNQSLGTSAGPLAAVPEPSALLLMLGGLAGLLACARRRAK